MSEGTGSYRAARRTWDGTEVVFYSPSLRSFCFLSEHRNSRSWTEYRLAGLHRRRDCIWTKGVEEDRGLHKWDLSKNRRRLQDWHSIHNFPRRRGAQGYVRQANSSFPTVKNSMYVNTTCAQFPVLPPGADTARNYTGNEDLFFSQLKRSPRLFLGRD